MCTGVITMIKVITNWPTTIDATANCTSGRPKIDRSGRAAAAGPDTDCRSVSRCPAEFPGVGAQEDEYEQRGEYGQHGADPVRPGINAAAKLLCEDTGRGDEQGAEDSADGAGEDDQPDDAGAPVARPHFGGDIACLLAGAVCHAGEPCAKAEQEER